MDGAEYEVKNGKKDGGNNHGRKNESRGHAGDRQDGI